MVDKKRVGCYNTNSNFRRNVLKKQRFLKKLYEYFMCTIGALLAAIAVFVFVNPNSEVPCLVTCVMFSIQIEE